MFTGIVKERGTIVSVDGGAEGKRLVVEAPATAAATALGDSVSVNGVDLTATEIDEGRMTFTAVPETLARTTLGSLTANAVCAMPLSAPVPRLLAFPSMNCGPSRWQTYCPA